MANIANARDTFMQNEAVRYITPNDRGVMLRASANLVKSYAAGTFFPTGDITFSPALINLSGDVNFAISPSNVNMTVANGVATVKPADMVTAGVDVVAVTASVVKDGITYPAIQTLALVRDGTAGKNGDSGLNNAVVYAYKRSAVAPTDSPGAVTYDFVNGRISTPTADALANGWTKSIPAGTDPLYVEVASASNSAAFDSIAANEWSSAVLLVQNGSNGSNGMNVATVYVYQRTNSTTPPAKPSAAVTFTFATGAVAGLNNNWSATFPAASGGKYLWVDTATAAAAAATDNIDPTEWSTVQLIAQDGTSGSRGAGHYYVQGSSWNSTVASAACPGGALVNDVVTISNGSNFVDERVYDGANWIVQSVVINGGLIVPGTITANLINTNGLELRDANGNLFFKAGSAPAALPIAFAPVGTVNADLAPAISSAATTANTDGSIRTPVVAYPTDNPDTRGAIKVRLPQSWTDTMMKFTVDIYEYVAGYSCTLEIAGYNYSGTPAWYNVSARVLGGSNVEYPVYFGHDGTKCCIWIGNANESWAYPQVRVRDFLAGHSNTSASVWATGWQLSFDTVAALNVTASVLDTYPAADWTKIPNKNGRPEDNANFTSASKGSALNDDPNIENVGAWTVEAGVIVAVTGGAAGGVGRNFFACDSGTDEKVYTKRAVAVDASKTYTLNAALFAAGGNNRNMYLFVNFYDVSGSQVGTNWGGAMSGYTFGGVLQTTDVWTRQGAPFGANTGLAIPATARTMTFGVWFQYSGGGSSAVRQGAMDIRCEDITLQQKALVAIDAISSDNMLSKGEKAEVLLNWNTIASEYSGTLNAGLNLGVDVTLTNAYTNAYNALSNYLPVGWNDPSVDTPIVGTTFRSKFTDYYTCKQALVNATAAKAATMASWSNVASKPADSALLNSYIATGGNLCYNSDFSNGLDGWHASYTDANNALYYSNASHPDGAGNGWSVNNGVGQGSSTLQFHHSGVSQTPAYIDVQSDPIPVIGGARYCVSAYTGAHRCIVDVFAYIYDSAGNTIGNWGNDSDYNNEQAAGGVNLAGYKRHMQCSTLPSNACFVKIVLRKFATKNINNYSDSWMFVSRVQLEQVAVNATAAGPWSLAGTVGATLGVDVRGQASSVKALSPTLGTFVTTGTARTEISDLGIRVYDASGALRIKIGKL